MASSPDAPLKISRAVKRQLRLDKLCSAMQRSRLALKVYRENRKRMLRLYAGSDWSENASDFRRPLNLIGMYVNVMSRSLVNQTPRVLLSTWNREHRRDVWTAQEWSNRQFDKIDLGATLHRWVLDALFWLGIIKTGITTPVESERRGFNVWAGEAFADTVDPDDYVCDMHARHFDELSYEGHRFRASVETANRAYRLRGENKLDYTNTTHNAEGDERVELIGRGYLAGDTEEWTDQTDLWEVYLHQHKVILTFRSQGGGAPSGADDLIESREYVGPYCGPYVKLGYLPVPGNLLPKGTVPDLIPLDVSINNMMRKLLRQCAAFKQLSLYTGAAAEDMRRIARASDGEAIQVDRINEIRQWISNQPSPQLFGLVNAFKQLFSMLGGNIEVLAGLSRQAGTAAQENLMNENAGSGVAHLSATTVKQTRKVIDNLEWYFHHDPQGVMKATYKLASDPNVQVDRELGPRERERIDWEDLEVKVDPYSLTSITPQARIQHMRNLLNTVIPIMPILQQKGVDFDAQYWLRKEGEYANNPDIEELFRLGEPLPGQTPKGDENTPGKPPVTNRTYTRKSESEATEAGQADDMMQKLMGAGMNGAGDFQGSE